MAIPADTSRIREVVQGAWRHHYRISELAYWACLAASLPAYRFVGRYVSDARPAVVAAALAAIIGIGRWHIDRHSIGGRLLVARFTTGDGVGGREVDAQRAILTQLRDRLTASEEAGVGAVSAVVGREDRRQAARLAKRLRAPMLLHGHIQQAAGDQWSVYARLLRTGAVPAFHWDLHTKDVTPSRTLRGEFFALLTPEVNVGDGEYPLALSTELEVVVRGTLALLIASFDPSRGIHELRDALALCPGSTSHQIDDLRAALARRLKEAGDFEEAVALLRTRAQGERPSPELCRTLAGFLQPLVMDRVQFAALPDAVRRALADEVIACYRTAALERADPLRDQTLYNLALATDEEAEAGRLMSELVSTSRFYRGAWYVHRELGARAWNNFEKQRASGDLPAARAAVVRAASAYSKAIKTRPRFRLHLRSRPPWLRVETFRRRPIMYANARDAHREAAHGIRARWYEGRMVRLRAHDLTVAESGFREGDYDKAYAHADWAVVGIGDLPDIAAHVYRAAALFQRGPEWEAGAQLLWQDAAKFGRPAFELVRRIAEEPLRFPLARPLPWT